MVDFEKKQASFARIEFWGFTTLFVFILFFFITDSLDGPSAIENAPFRNYFKSARAPFSYYTHYFIPQLVRNIFLFTAFIALNFFIVPKIVKRERLWRNIFLFVMVFLVLGLVFGITSTYLRGYQYTGSNRDEVDQRLFSESFGEIAVLVGVLVIYSLIKYTGLFLLSNTEAIRARFKFMTREVIVASMIWMIMLLLLLMGEADKVSVFSWAILIPYAIMLYAFSFHKLIPRALTKKRPLLAYFLRGAATIGILFFPLLMLLSISIDRDETVFDLSSFNTVFQLFITLPVTWMLYKRQQKGNEEVTVLTKELKRSTANIDFLRSQINPHFLFNALNTIYGTAIQEKAERTSEAVVKLGDMMRFMLQENMQEKISLSREIDYLNNYISLQRLRTDTNPIVQIQTEIQERETIFQIAPMLLIPFVENAFKHGISFREPSHIKVTLEIKNNTLYFDVYNSKHVRQSSDPEKDKSGIGLENVKQRLKLLYPNRHELIIRDTTREFFIHLTIQLA